MQLFTSSLLMLLPSTNEYQTPNFFFYFHDDERR